MLTSYNRISRLTGWLAKPTRTIGNIMAIVFMLVLSLSCGGGDPVGGGSGTGTGGSGSGTGGTSSDEAILFAQSLGAGWNLGNNLDAHAYGKANETSWGNKAATQATFDAVKKAGFSSVRIPVTWIGQVGSAPEYTINAAWMNRVEQVVGYAHNAGLKVIINIHHDGAASDGKMVSGAWLDVKGASTSEATNAEIKTRLKKMWTQIANRFKKEGDWLIFETLNEIHDGNWGSTVTSAQYRVLNEWNQTCVDAIRATGGNNATRYIGIPGYAANPSYTVNNLKMPNDATANRIMVAVHSYDPWDFAGSGVKSSWGSGSADYPYGESSYKNMLLSLYNKYVKNGIPVYIGEYGCVHRDISNAAGKKAEEYRKKYLEYVTKTMKEYKMSGFVWDNGSTGYGEEAFGLFNHGTGAYINNAEEIVKILTINP